MDTFAAVVVLLIGYYLRFVNGEGNGSASSDNNIEILSDDPYAMSRRQRDAGIPIEHTGVCGVPPVKIDKRLFRCDGGVTVAVTKTARKPTTTMEPATTKKPQGSCSGLLTCNGKLYCGADQGYSCCGFERYTTEFQTCCRYTSAKYRIYDDMQEKSHVCCGLDVYKRGSSDIPCEHASSNDRFFRQLTKLRKLRRDQALCKVNEHQTMYVYKIDVDVQVTKGNRRYLEATIAMWPWRPNAKSKNRTDVRNAPAEKGYMEIRLDKYSPRKKNLIGSSFFTITRKKYLEKAVFFLYPTDNLYKWPKSVKMQGKITNWLKKMQRKCRKQGQLSV